MAITNESEFKTAIENQQPEIEVTGSYADKLWQEYKEARKSQMSPSGYFRKAPWADRDNWLCRYKMKSLEEGKLIFESFSFDLYVP